MTLVSAVRASRSSDGHAFWAFTFMPPAMGVMQARTVGTPSTSTRQLGHAPPQQSSPRGRWYLKEREKMRTPEA